MAEKSKTTVRRIKATDDKPTKSSSTKPAKKATVSKKVSSTTKKQSVKKPAPKKPTSTKEEKHNAFQAIGNYFKGAWYELKQVRWPTRSATWGMTVAVLAFTLILGTIILLLDAGFNEIFELIFK